MLIRLSVFFLLGVLLCSPVIGQKKIFIAPNGNDQAIGSFQQPVATAQQAILLASQTNIGKVELLFRIGVYYLDSMILLSAASL